ncbi:MAG: hypothetical protein ACI35S_04180 [Anaeroplasma sp.]
MLEFKERNTILENINKLEKKTKIISFIRLLLGLCFIFFVICLVSLKEHLLFLLLSIVLFVIYIIFVIFTNKYFLELEHLKNKEKVYISHENRRNHNLNSFYDSGNDFLDKDDYKLSDLDLFGKNSLFSFLSVAKTKFGRCFFAKQLINPEEKGIEYTKTISEMAENEATLDIEAGLLSFSSDAKNANYEEFNNVVNFNIDFKLKFIMPIISFIITLIYIILVFTINLNPYFIIAFLLLNVLSAKVCLKNDVFNLNSTAYYNICDSYINLSKIIINTKLNSKYYNSLKNEIKEELDKLIKLRKIYSTLSSRRNIIVNIGLNALFIYDFWIIIFYNKQIKLASSISKAFIAVGEIEAMLSFSNVGKDGNIYCIPELSNTFTIENMIHPLIKNPVSNSISFSGGIVLTGSNMSGKTTFMRTLGINQVLFNAGSIVYASIYKAPRIPIFTSLRANDMLIEGVSTFYAEILRMKKMNQAIKNGKCLILVDEIFKGTNASERIKASFSVINKFNEYDQFFIISTHDFELCDADRIKNYHFSEHYEGDKIKFDYKIKEGKCESTNAIYLLRMANIIE